MHAELGDELIIESPATGVARRDGEIIGLRHGDGTPPYDVRWSDTGRVSLVFPGPDAHVRHLHHHEGPGTAPGPAEPGRPGAGPAEPGRPGAGGRG